MYMKPEVLRAKPYSHSVNYWSLGYILFGLPADSPPVQGERTQGDLGESQELNEGIEKT